MRYILANSGKPVDLGQELGRGGEGVVYAVHGHNSWVAKVYAKPPDPDKVHKLQTMTKTANAALERIASWPIDLLLGQNKVCGFIMPRISARRDIHELYSPKSRAQTFPDADFRFLVHVAANVARAFVVMHEHGHVIGDVNHGNLLVAPNGTVTFIDCDSFQIANGDRIFTCDVGVPLFTAPELHGQTLRGLVRFPNHDLFGLAVLLFHLLYMGRHPFAGRYLGPGDMPIERAIAEYRFAYGPDRVAKGMERPPATIPLETMGAPIASLFAEAFSEAGATGSRPEAKTWVHELGRLEASLRECASASWHHFPNHLPVCPWCTIERETGIRLFGLRIIANELVGAVDIGELWKAITALPEPSVDPPLPSERPWRMPTRLWTSIYLIKVLRVFFSVGLMCTGLVSWGVLGAEWGIMAALLQYALAWAVWPRVPAQRRDAANRSYLEAQAQWEQSLSLWKRSASKGAYTSKLSALSKARAELADLPNERHRALARLDAERLARQKERYLDRFRIDAGKIRGIGPGRSAMLASYGIETAADIDDRRIEAIPGFGSTLTAELVAWRQSHEQNFRYNPSEPLNPFDIAAIDRRLETRKKELLAMLQQGPSSLQAIYQEIIASRPQLIPILEQNWRNLKIAEARRKSP